MKTVAFHTLGCKVNQYETEAMEELFEKKGYSIVDGDELADIYVINTCTVTNLSDRKSRQFIRKAKKLNGNPIIAVVGCYSQVSPEEVEKIDGVDVIIGTSERNRIVELCEEAKRNSKKINIVRDIKKYKKFDKINIDEIKSKSRAYIKIQDGCNQFCSYCIIPYARGPIRSRAYDEIISETQKLADANFKEIVLTGIHVASYGKDLDKLPLIQVIKGIGNLYQISNQITLGETEEEIINKLNKLISQVVTKERNTRKFLQNKKGIEVEDKVFRSYGILCNSRLISSKEAMKHLSNVKLAYDMGYITDTKLEGILKLMVDIMPANLQNIVNKEAEKEERDKVRAKLIRDYLSGMEV
mgnify:CR=1 FL=1